MNILATAYTNTNALIGITRTSDSLLEAARALLSRITRQSTAPAAPRDPIREAGQVRRMADEIRFSDPRFAADLYAAADRHERIYAIAIPCIDAPGLARAAPAAR